MKKDFLSKNYAVWLLATLCCMLWGSAFPAIKKGYSLLDISSDDTASIILFAGIRFFFAGVLTLIIFRPPLPKKSSFKSICVLSVFQTILQYTFFYLGLAFTSGAKGSVINGSSVFFALLISSVLFKMEKLELNKIIGSVIGFAGVILVSLSCFSESASLKGDCFILISSISYAFSTVLMKRYSKDNDPAMLSGWQFLLGGIILTLIGFAFGGRITFNLSGTAVLIYLSFLSAAAYSIWSILLKYNPVSKVAVCGFMIPVFGYILSSLFSGESFSGALSVAALVFVAAGIIIVNLNNNFKGGKLCSKK